MKTFVYTQRTPNNKKLAEQIEINIYQIKHNKPTHIGTTYMKLGLSKGADSEVFNYLIARKYVPKWYGTININMDGGFGYYTPEVRDMGLDIIGLI